jgi:hypothetical protein
MKAWESVILYERKVVPMSTNLPRLSVTLKPEWEPELDELKRTVFYDKPRADVLRYLIDLGLEAWRQQQVVVQK